MASDAAIYSSRLITLYLKLLRERYPYVSIGDVLDYAGIETYEVNDEGHWITQEQIDRFYERIVQLTDNPNIAREAGRLAGSPGAIGVMRQYTLGLLGPALAFAMINKATRNFTRGNDYSSKPISSHSVEIVVEQRPGIVEKPFQCENRMGFFEAIVGGFNLGMPGIEHPECMFKGGAACRYMVTWKNTVASVALKVRNATIALSLLGVSGWLLAQPKTAALIGIPTAVAICTLACWLTEIYRGQEMKQSLDSLWDSAEKLTEQINTNARNIQFTQDVGQALANKKSVDDVLKSVVQTMERRLDFDQVALLLANADRTCLEIRGAYGYSQEQLSNLSSTVFSLTNPASQGPFVLSFHQRKPFLINDVQEIEEKVTAKSRRFIDRLGVKSFLCCPIVVEGQPLGILAATNLTTKRPLIKSDVSLMLGVAPVIGVALQNAALIEEVQGAFEKTLRVLADSIDARDFLTAGHSDAVTEYAAGISEQMNLDSEYIQMIRVAGLLHDYGKIGVPDAILKKNGRLTVEERAIINTHPAKTREILSQVPFRGVQTQIPEITGAHHERWDGQGYPNGLKGEEIPLGARILAVADFFEAITAQRHYRDPMPLAVAIEQLQEGIGKNFDPEVVEAFMRYVRERKFCLITPDSVHTGSGYTRKSPRVDYRSQVSVKLGQRVLSGNLLNLSMDGAYVSCVEPVGEKDEVAITFTPPDTDSLVQIRARVVWANNISVQSSSKHPVGFGLQFIDLPASTENLFRRFIDHGRATWHAGKIIYPKQFARS